MVGQDGTRLKNPNSHLSDDGFKEKLVGQVGTWLKTSPFNVTSQRSDDGLKENLNGQVGGTGSVLLSNSHDVLREDTGITQCHTAAKGMSDDRERCQVLLVNKLRKIIDILTVAIGTAICWPRARALERARSRRSRRRHPRPSPRRSWRPTGYSRS